uniref:Uncharacterized protein n=1 Tax=Cannabis sativa TaxID=3483 RepID=A0A803P2D0_CANSA
MWDVELDGERFRVIVIVQRELGRRGGTPMVLERLRHTSVSVEFLRMSLEIPRRLTSMSLSLGAKLLLERLVNAVEDDLAVLIE